MPKIANSAKLVVEFDELTDEIALVIKQEMFMLYKDLQQKGADVHDTWNFHDLINAPKKTSYGWLIHLRAKYSDILWRGRRTIGSKSYGSLKWFAGGAPMMAKTENKIAERLKNVKR